MIARESLFHMTHVCQCAAMKRECRQSNATKITGMQRRW